MSFGLAIPSNLAGGVARSLDERDDPGATPAPSRPEDPFGFGTTEVPEGPNRLEVFGATLEDVASGLRGRRGTSLDAVAARRAQLRAERQANMRQRMQNLQLGLQLVDQARKRLREEVPAVSVTEARQQEARRISEVFGGQGEELFSELLGSSDLIGLDARLASSLPELLRYLPEVGNMLLQGASQQDIVEFANQPEQLERQLQAKGREHAALFVNEQADDFIRFVREEDPAAVERILGDGEVTMAEFDRLRLLAGNAPFAPTTAAIDHMFSAPGNKLFGVSLVPDDVLLQRAKEREKQAAKADATTDGGAAESLPGSTGRVLLGTEQARQIARDRGLTPQTIGDDQVVELKTRDPAFDQLLAAGGRVLGDVVAPTVEIRQLREKAVQVNNVVSQINEVRDLLALGGARILSVSGRGQRIFDALRSQAVGFLDSIGGSFAGDEGQPVDVATFERRQLKRHEETLDQIAENVGIDGPAAANIFKSRIVVLTFTTATAVFGQTGHALSDNDFDRTFQAIGVLGAAGASPDQIDAALASLGQLATRQLNSRLRIFRRDPAFAGQFLPQPIDDATLRQRRTLEDTDRFRELTQRLAVEFPDATPEQIAEEARALIREAMAGGEDE